MGLRLPIYSRDEGNVARARINLQQSHAQTISNERRVTDDVERAHLDCELSLSELSRTDLGTFAKAARIRDAAERNYLAQSTTREPQARTGLEALLLACSQYEKEERRYVGVLLRYLQSALDLNTAVGKRIMP